jgi:hypothetical protein
MPQQHEPDPLSENTPPEQLDAMPLGELRRQAAAIAATADEALTRYTALRRSPRGTATESIEGAHATWRARYQLRDQLAAIVRKRELELGQGRMSGKLTGGVIGIAALLGIAFGAQAAT